MVTLPMDETMPLSSVRYPGERRHALFLCGGREKRVCPLVRARIQSYDLAPRVNCQGLADDSTRGMEAGQDAILIEKPITDRVSPEVVDADDLALRVNRHGQSAWWRAGGMERSEDAGIIEKPILGNRIWTLWTIAPPANDLAPVVYGCRLGEYSAGGVEAGEGALMMIIKNPMSIPLTIEANPDDLAPVVNCEREGMEFWSTGGVEDGEDTLLIEKPMIRFIDVESDDLPLCVNCRGLGA
jgi:hypothetical protein